MSDNIMDRSLYLELLNTERPFQFQAISPSIIKSLTISSFGPGADIPFCYKLCHAKCVFSSNVNRDCEMREVSITPKEMLLLEGLLALLRHNNSPVLACLGDLPERCSAFLENYHPAYIHTIGDDTDL